MRSQIQLMKIHIAQTFLQIMSEPGSSKVTVTLITEAAKITRRTFYYHFEDIRDLAIWIFRKELSESLMQRIDKSRLIFSENDKYNEFCFYMNSRTPEHNLDLTEFWYALYDYMNSRCIYYKNLFNNRMIFNMSKYLFDLYAPELRKDIMFYTGDRKINKDVVDFLVSFYDNAIIGWYINVFTEDLIMYRNPVRQYMPEVNNLAIESLKFEIDKIAK